MKKPAKQGGFFIFNVILKEDDLLKIAFLLPVVLIMRELNIGIIITGCSRLFSRSMTQGLDRQKPRN
ncbi:hypothetical protein EGT71_06410 [Atlantibacter subterranea]|uniref:Uncharacterized protein n=1 Tax=Atlantibacter subterraneus TaxID=255519 RepID=A0A427V5J5_9ENTR|nr:hypothetical protein [Atlantibacter subterranea]MDA3134661.1 hypothetical protein [Atlantibacter subterranea]RSB63821.1 hypothetical protein EGK67_06880 [Atlantibacter subterranea]RSE06497.1 hypothetical protein EGT84_08465 [Atlantibacter subterranea]RSE28012.1 hypothetical protein EGT71_06410 [Atlantibacter subterranea]